MAKSCQTLCCRKGKLFWCKDLVAVRTKFVMFTVDFYEIDPERRAWLVKTGCRYIWQKPEALVARTSLYENLKRVGMDPENIVLDRIEHDMDKYFYAFNIVDLNKML